MPFADKAAPSEENRHSAFAAKCMRSCARCERTACGALILPETAPTRPQAVPGTRRESGGVQSGKRPRTWSPGLLACSCFGMGWLSPVGCARNGGRATGRISSRKRNSASTRTAPRSTAAQCGAAARCCQRNGRVAQSRAGEGRQNLQQRSRPRHAIFAACSLHAAPSPDTSTRPKCASKPLCAALTWERAGQGV